MKLNSTVILTFLLLSLMVAAGFVSGVWGYTLGRAALKGVTQPDSRPNSFPSSTEGMKPRHQGVEILREADIIQDVKSRIENGPKSNQPPETSSQAPTSPVAQAATTEVIPVSHSTTVAAVNWPISSQSEGVMMQVLNAQPIDDALVLSVNLQNNGSRSVRFLYSFMNITDDKGRTYIANTKGLPGELPPDRQSFSGEISLPMALLEDSRDLSIELFDYPDQHVQLQISGIPVNR